MTTFVAFLFSNIIKLVFLDLGTDEFVDLPPLGEISHYFQISYRANNYLINRENNQQMKN